MNFNANDTISSMELKEAITFFESYNLILLLLGIAILAASVLPRVLSNFPLSLPIILLGIGYTIFTLPLAIVRPDPNLHSTYIEHVTELAVILSIMGAGLKINRPLGFKSWLITWRLLGITMVLTIVLVAIAGWYIAAFVPATALLLGAVIAPTDPVLASETEIEGPGEEPSKKGALKFALTSEAGVNDGLAFPFTHMAIAMALYGLHPANWFGSWFLVHVLYEISIGILVGTGVGYLLARFILNLSATTKFAKSIIGIGALASTLIIYGFTESLGGYGFIAVFCGAVVIRQYDRDHEYQIALHAFTEKSQLIFTSLLVLGLGAAISGGILKYLDTMLILVALLAVLVIRPLCGMIGLIGLNSVPFKERFAISFFGIRGFGSIYYLAYALNHYDFEGAQRIWSLVVLIVVLSICIHGITASPILKRLNQL
jgi:NhaP-type Na+/H+ or K+/H+ antiporter